MAQKTSNAPQPASQPVTEAPEKSGSSTAREAGSSLFALSRATVGQSVVNKQAFLGDIRQRLAQVADESKAHGEHAQETEALADTSGTRLYQARVAGVITQDELNGLLGDVFGYKPKQDGTPGKTPAGMGELIRKRVVRAVQGTDFISGGDGGRFFETMDPAEVAPVIASIGRTKKNEKGETVSDGISLWMAWKKLGDMKSQGTVRLPFAFDPKKILSLTESLSEAGAREKLMGNPSLLKAYGGLFDQLRILDQVDPSEVEEVRTALGIGEEAETETETEDNEQVAA